MADALRVPVVREPVYPYKESPPLDDVMSYIIRSSIQWGSDPRITSVELTENTYLFFRIAYHSLWPSLLSDVCFCTLLFLVCLLVFLICFFVL